MSSCELHPPILIRLITVGSSTPDDNMDDMLTPHKRETTLREQHSTRHTNDVMITALIVLERCSVTALHPLTPPVYPNAVTCSFGLAMERRSIACCRRFRLILESFSFPRPPPSLLSSELPSFFVWLHPLPRLRSRHTRSPTFQSGRCFPCFRAVRVAVWASAWKPS